MINTETLARHAATVTSIALRRSLFGGNLAAAIVNTGELAPLKITHQAIAEKLMHPGPGVEVNWQLLSAEQFIRAGSRNLGVPANTRGLLVTDYSDNILKQGRRDDEARLQLAVKYAFYDSGRFSSPNPLTVLVLSGSMPHDHFQDNDLPWENGPFQSSRSLWSIAPMGTPEAVTGLSLTEHYLGHTTSMSKKVWSNRERFEIPLPESTES